VHEEMASWYAVRNNVITVSMIIAGVVITTVTQLPLDGPWMKFALAVLGVLSTALASIVKFLGYEAKNKAHVLVAQQFLNLRQDIELQLCLPVTDEAAFVVGLSKSYRAIIAASPVTAFDRRSMAPGAHGHTDDV